MQEMNVWNERLELKTVKRVCVEQPIGKCSRQTLFLISVEVESVTSAYRFILA
jgi:hypothetical protein